MTNEAMDEIRTVVNSIWSQAGIYLELDRIDQIHYVVSSAVDWDMYTFKTGEQYLNDSYFSIVGIFTTHISGRNGFSLPGRSPVFVVKEDPSLDYVPFETIHTIGENEKVARVCSHEIGHILGLNHFHNPNQQRDRLMFSGSRGTRLNALETNIARSKAKWYLSLHDLK